MARLDFPFSADCVQIACYDRVGMAYRFLVPIAYASPLVPAWILMDGVAGEFDVVRMMVKEGVLSVLCVLLLLLYRHDRIESEKRMENIAKTFQDAIMMVNQANENMASRIHELTLVSAFGRYRRRASYPQGAPHVSKKDSGSE